MTYCQSNPTNNQQGSIQEDSAQGFDENQIPLITVADQVWDSQIPLETPTNESAPRKIALLVGIDKYTEVSPLNGCVNDVLLMRDLLMKKYAFSTNDIKILTNEKATRQNIINTFQSHLIKQAKEGDIIVFHFSGHGSQQWDSQPYEEEDKKDEILIPHDFSYNVGGIRGISDDAINGLLKRLTDRTNNVTFILDACHSGAATKSLFTKRSPKNVEMDNRPAPPAEEFDLPDEAAKDGAGSKGLSGHGRSKANYVLISGCRADEQSYENELEGGKKHGLLTYYLVEELRKASGQLTYNDIMDNVKSKVTKQISIQHPQLEGANINSFVFGDPTAQLENYLIVNPTASQQVVKVVGGVMLGLTEGSRFEVYKPATRMFRLPEKPVALIEIIKVGTSASDAKVISGKVSTENSRAVERKHNYKDQQLHVYFAGKWNSSPLSENKAQILALPYVKASPNAHIVLKETGNRVALTMAYDTTNVLQTFPMDLTLKDNLLKAVSDWSKWFNVLSLDNTNPLLKVEMNLISVKERGKKGPLDFIGETDYTFNHGDQVEIEIKNKSDQDLFFYLIDLQDNGSIDVFHLGDFQDPPLKSNQVIKAGDTWKDTLTVEVTPGKKITRDILKLFATTDSEVRLEFLKSIPAAGTKGPEKSVEKIFEDRSVRPGTNRDEQVDLHQWTTLDRVLVVKK